MKINTIVYTTLEIRKDVWDTDMTFRMAEVCDRREGGGRREPRKTHRECISYISVAVIKHHDQVNLQKKEFI